MTLNYKNYRKNDQFNKCAICQEEYQPTELIVETRCLHQFHPDCLKNALRHRPHCPICRQKIVISEKDPELSQEIKAIFSSVPILISAARLLQYPIKWSRKTPENNLPSLSRMSEREVPSRVEIPHDEPMESNIESNIESNRERQESTSLLPWMDQNNDAIEEDRIAQQQFYPEDIIDNCPDSDIIMETDDMFTEPEFDYFPDNFHHDSIPNYEDVTTNYEDVTTNYGDVTTNYEDVTTNYGDDIRDYEDYVEPIIEFVESEHNSMNNDDNDEIESIIQLSKKTHQEHIKYQEQLKKAVQMSLNNNNNKYIHNNNNDNDFGIPDDVLIEWAVQESNESFIRQNNQNNENISQPRKNQPKPASSLNSVTFQNKKFDTNNWNQTPLNINSIYHQLGEVL